MNKIKKTLDNPHGLSNKQKLVIADVAQKVQKGQPIQAVESTEKIYSVTSKRSAHTISSRNMNNPDFRAALIDELAEKQILGPNGAVNVKLVEGLDAEVKGEADHRTRLEFIKEIHKVVGVYAPQQIEKKSLSLHADITSEELDQRISDLQKELKS